jgi:hypothetical protein
MESRRNQVSRTEPPWLRLMPVHELSKDERSMMTLSVQLD